MKNKTRTSLKLISTAVLLAIGTSWVWAAPDDWPKSAAAGSGGSAGATASVASVTPIASVTTTATVAEPYKILLAHSIFSKDGVAMPSRPLRPSSGPWSKPGPTNSTQPTSFPTFTRPDPERDYVLRGVGMQDGVFAAFFEQTSLNKGYTAHVGEKLARGQIMAMSLDGIEYTLNGKSTRILIGQSLDGRVVESAHSATASSFGGSDHTSRWIRHDTSGAIPASAEEQGDAKMRADKERSRWGGARPGEQDRPSSDDRTRTDDRGRGDKRTRAEGPQQPDTDPNRGADPRPAEGAGPGAAAANPAPAQPDLRQREADDEPTPFDFFDPN